MKKDENQTVMKNIENLNEQLAERESFIRRNKKLSKTFTKISLVMITIFIGMNLGLYTFLMPQSIMWACISSIFIASPLIVEEAVQHISEQKEKNKIESEINNINIRLEVEQTRLKNQETIFVKEKPFSTMPQSKGNIRQGVNRNGLILNENKINIGNGYISFIDNGEDVTIKKFEEIEIGIYKTTTLSYNSKNMTYLEVIYNQADHTKKFKTYGGKKGQYDKKALKIIATFLKDIEAITSMIEKSETEAKKLILENPSSKILINNHS